MLSGLWGRFRRARGGAAALEFALIAPVMLLFYFGTSEVTQLVRADSKVSASADTIGNLVTRLKTVDDTAFTNIFDIASAVMNPFDPGDLQIVVTAVRVDDKGKGTVHWSHANHGQGLKAGDPFTVPDDLKTHTSSYFVMSTTSYPYRPAIRWVGSAASITLTHSNIFRPRKSNEITED